MLTPFMVKNLNLVLHFIVFFMATENALSLTFKIKKKERELS